MIFHFWGNKLNTQCILDAHLEVYVDRYEKRTVTDVNNRWY